MALPRGAMGLSAVCDVVFPDHTYLLFFVVYMHLGIAECHISFSGNFDLDL